MPTYYIDSSALVKRYIEVDGSRFMDRLLDDPATVAYTSRITAVEATSEITRRGRGARWPEEWIEERTAGLSDDLEFGFRIVDASPAILEAARILARRHGLRGYDAVHLASALDIHALHNDAGALRVVLVSADDELNAAAESDGMTVLNPLR